MKRRLRIIRDTARPAAFNMAADLFLLEQAALTGGVFLRIYQWSPPAVSLGCMQNEGHVLDLEKMKAAGIGWIKRPTGGRSILHWNDLTYSLAFPLSEPAFGGTIAESYAVISRCLVAGLGRAGIRCETHDSLREYGASKHDMKLACFLSPNRGEIMVRGKKLVGSAQKRGADAVLQHGSIPMDNGFRRLPEFLNIPDSERLRQRELLDTKSICIAECDPAVDGPRLADSLARGFSETLSYDAGEQPWQDEETETIAGRWLQR